MRLGKVFRKEFGWLVVCSVFVDALSAKTVFFHMIYYVSFSWETHKNEANARVCPQKS